MSNVYDVGKEIVYQFANIINPHQSDALTNWAEDKRLSHYTTADAAIKILDSGTLWLTDSRLMKDYSEISYGIDLLSYAFNNGWAAQFVEEVGAIIGTSRIDSLLKEKLSAQYLKGVTYLSCLTEHHPKDDIRGRLSMWRAYGDTAIVLKAKYMLRPTWNHRVFVAPLHYQNSEKYLRGQFAFAADVMRENARELEEAGEEYIESILQAMRVLYAISAKHPGFTGENEVRLAHFQLPGDSAGMGKKTVTLNGIPQRVWEYPLTLNDEEEDKSGTMDEVISQIIIGPSEHKEVRREAFVDKLSELRVKSPWEKVFVSDIPLMP